MKTVRPWEDVSKNSRVDNSAPYYMGYSRTEWGAMLMEVERPGKMKGQPRFDRLAPVALEAVQAALDSPDAPKVLKGLARKDLKRKSNPARGKASNVWLAKFVKAWEKRTGRSRNGLKAATYQALVDQGHALHGVGFSADRAAWMAAPLPWEGGVQGMRAPTRNPGYSGRSAEFYGKPGWPKLAGPFPAVHYFVDAFGKKTKKTFKSQADFEAWMEKTGGGFKVVRLPKYNPGADWHRARELDEIKAHTQATNKSNRDYHAGRMHAEADAAQQSRAMGINPLLMTMTNPGGPAAQARPIVQEVLKMHGLSNKFKISKTSFSGLGYGDGYFVTIEDWKIDRELGMRVKTFILEKLSTIALPSPDEDRWVVKFSGPGICGNPGGAAQGKLYSMKLGLYPAYNVNMASIVATGKFAGLKARAIQMGYEPVTSKSGHPWPGIYFKNDEGRVVVLETVPPSHSAFAPKKPNPGAAEHELQAWQAGASSRMSKTKKEEAKWLARQEQEEDNVRRAKQLGMPNPYSKKFCAKCGEATPDGICNEHPAAATVGASKLAKLQKRWVVTVPYFSGKKKTFLFSAPNQEAAKKKLMEMWFEGKFVWKGAQPSRAGWAVKEVGKK